MASPTAPSQPPEGVRYAFRKSHGALVLIGAGAVKHKGEWIAEDGQLQGLSSIREQCVARGFTTIGELGMSGDRPTADDVRSFVRGIAERDFSEHDALLICH